MKTVQQVIALVYETDKRAGEAHGVKAPAVCNWKARGHFPAHYLPRIIADAKARGVHMELDEVPITKPLSEAA